MHLSNDELSICQAFQVLYNQGRTAVLNDCEKSKALMSTSQMSSSVNDENAGLDGPGIVADHSQPLTLR